MPPIPPPRPRPKYGGLRILNDRPEDRGKTVVSVIVTIKNGVSYDQLFTKVEQKIMDGNKVEVYQCNGDYIDSLISAF